MSASRATPHAGASRRAAVRPFEPLRWIEYGSTAMAFAVLAQAALAGQIVSGAHGFMTPHRVVAEFLPLAGLGLALLPWIHQRPGRDGLAAALAAGAVLVIVQTGLGFIGRESAAAVAVHVPVGVVILGIYVGCTTTARSRRTSLATA